MLDCENSDFFCNMIEGVVDEVWIFPRDDFAYTLNLLPSSEFGKHDKVL